MSCLREAPLVQRPKVSNGSCGSVCLSVTDFSDFYEAHMRRLHPLFPLLSFQLGFSGIPENDEKTSISPSNERYTWTPFWDPFLSLFSEKVPFFPRGLRPLFASLRRNPARRVYLVSHDRLGIITSVPADLTL